MPNYEKRTGPTNMKSVNVKSEKKSGKQKAKQYRDNLVIRGGDKLKIYKEKKVRALNVRKKERNDLLEREKRKNRRKRSRRRGHLMQSELDCAERDKKNEHYLD